MKNNKTSQLPIFYTLWGYSLYVLLILILFIILLILYFIPFNKDKKISNYFIKLICNLFYILNFKQKNFFDFNRLSVPVKGEKRIYIINHTSIFDSLMIYSLPGIIKTIMKDDYLKIPLVNFVSILSGNIILKKNSRLGESIFNKIFYQMESGSAFVIYPEGSRSKDSKIGKFKKGVFKLAKKIKADLIPVVFDNWNVIRPGSLRIRELNIHIGILNTIRYDSYKEYPDRIIADTVRSQMIEKLIDIRNKRRESEKNYYRNTSYYLEQDIEHLKECLNYVK